MSDYWNRAYEVLDLPRVPSQFAAFVANEVSRDTTIIDLGCGNGKDVFFFKSLGFKAIGVDASKSAIEYCNKEGASADELVKHLFIHSDVVEYLREIGNNEFSPVCFYSRFLYHSLDDIQAIQFIRELAICIYKNKCNAYLEFRSFADINGTKITPDHFRRFETSEMFSKKCDQYGLSISYLVEGRGFAKWRDDDAIVIRAVISATQ
jgi:SAM-dependent methyltransferase